MKRIKVVNQSQMSIVPVSVRSRTRIAASLRKALA